jgi:hypothetical protein
LSGLGGIWRAIVETPSPLAVSVPALTGASQIFPNVTAPAGQLFAEGQEVWVGALDGDRERLVVVAGAALAVPTAGRPAASSVPVGAMLYDTTLHVPVWSDGAAWRNAGGFAV